MADIDHRDGSASLADVRDAVARVTKGKDVREEAWMTTWCNTSWGDLLQPAPLSISLLGSILIIASATEDFSLITDRPEGAPEFEWKYADHPDCFQTCLQQLVGAGYTAFETVHGNMETIKNTSTQMPDVITDLVELVLTGQADAMEDNFSSLVSDILEMSNKCMKAATSSEKAFGDITGLCQELVLACTYRAGTAQQALNQNDIQLAVLKVQKEQEDLMVKQAKETADMMKKSYTDAESQFHDAVNSVPSGWDLVGMQVVESLTSLAVSAGNAFISQATMRSQAMSAGIGAFKHETGGDDAGTPAAATPSPTVPTTSPTGIATLPSGGALSDPAVALAQNALTYANALVSLIGEGKPEWDLIRSTDPNSQSGAAYVQASFESIKSRLDPSKTISPRLITFIDRGIQIVTDVIKVAKSVESSDDKALAQYEPEAASLVSDLQSLVTSCNLILQQPGTAATGPATPSNPNPASVTNSATKMAVENAKFKVDSTKSALEAARGSFEKASNQLMTQQQEITKTIGEMTKLSLTNTTLTQMLPVLKKAVGSFTTLRAQFSQLVQFFTSVSSLLNDVMGPSVNRWVKTISAGEARAVAGVTISAFTRDLIYRQCQTPLKVAMLSEQISTTYGDVSEKYILPAQRQVGQMLKFADGKSESDKKKLLAQLQTAQTKLASDTQESSQGIHDLVEQERQKFASMIDKRLAEVVEGMANVLPAVQEPVPEHIKVIQDSHVEDFAATKEAQAAVNPMFDPSDA